MAKKSILGSLKKITKSMKYWYVKDENGQINNTARILFQGIIACPIVIFEGIKVGFYVRCVHNEGLPTALNGLLTPAFKVYQMRHMNPDTGFGSQYSGFEPAYVGVFMLFYATIFASLYMTAERNKNKSSNKDGEIKFCSHDKFNAELARTNAAGEPEEPEENSGETGNMILSQNLRTALKGSDVYSCALVIGAIGSGKSFKQIVWPG